MAGINLRYLHQWTDHRKQAEKPRYYFRRAGYPRVRLPGLPGSPEFLRAYEAAIANQPPPLLGPARAKPGSIDALAVAFYTSSPAWLALSPQTRATDRLIIEKFRKLHGDKPVALLGRPHVNKLLTDRVDTPLLRTTGCA